MQDSWETGDAYDLFMGRWSRLVADEFLDWLSPNCGLSWLDVGCGSGALSEAVSKRAEPTKLAAIDQSEGCVKTAQARLGSQAICNVGNALNLPIESNSVDFGFGFEFYPEPRKSTFRNEACGREKWNRGRLHLGLCEPDGISSIFLVSGF